jgi:flagellar L-ring protein precursor FlgH
MWRLGLSLLWLGLAAGAASAQGNSLWARRDVYAPTLFEDTRARRVGDLLTVLVNESTELEGRDKKELSKDTKGGGTLDLAAKYAAGKLTTREFTGSFAGNGTSTRSLDAKANNTIDRRFVDHMTVIVVAVLPNGNLVIEGQRKQVITREARTLYLSGIVRPLDIGPYNTIQSLSIAEMKLVYDGHGPESSYTNNGWFGRFLNKVWPF